MPGEGSRSGRRLSARSFSRTRRGIAANANNREQNADFISALSHELRSPLNAIAGFVSVLEMGVHGPINDQQRDDLLRIRKSQEKLLAFINQVVTFARLEAGEVDLHIENVDVAELLQETAALIYPQLAATGLQYSCTVNSAELIARADREKLRQILVHILLNALKFTACPGRIEVSARVGSNEQIEISVRDSGCGIALEQLDEIFSPVAQARGRRGLNGSAVKLGLPISRSLARAMGGDISVASMEGDGATFTIHVPSVMRV